MPTTEADRVMTSGNPLRLWRLKHGVPMAAAAARIGVSGTILKEWEAGSVTPRPDRYERIAALMGVDPDALRRAWDRWQRRVQGVLTASNAKGEGGGA